MRKATAYDRDGTRAYTSLGEHLHANLQDGFVVLGTLYAHEAAAERAETPDESALRLDGPDGAFARSGRESFALNLRQLERVDRLPALLKQRVRIWHNPGAAAEMHLVPAESLDALFFVDTVSAARTYRAAPPLSP